MAQNILNQTKFIPEIVEALLSELENGAHIHHACALAGIKRQTLYNWITRAEKGDKGFDNFDTRVEKARINGIRKMEADTLALCKNEKKPDARTMHRILTSKDRAVYSEDHHVEISGQLKVDLGLPDLIAAMEKAEKEEDVNGA